MFISISYCFFYPIESRRTKPTRFATECLGVTPL
jgi:hypothetical protein